jgi:hypothetical protein
MLAALGEGFYGNFGLKHVFKDILRDGIKHRLREPGCELLENKGVALVAIDDFGNTWSAGLGKLLRRCILLVRSKKFK